MRKVCIVTGSRAEYGLLYRLMMEFKNDPDLDLQIVATGMHLSPEYGLTYQQIEKDGFHINKKIEMLLSSDSPTGICKSMGLGLISFSEVFRELNPDIIILLGDRFETFCAASAACVRRIPIAHLYGGETTQGAIDEAFRHSITKMSQLHFTSTELYRHRVIQLGERPKFVFNVGALGVENICKLKLLDRKELETTINFTLSKPCILVTFHPVTLENNTAKTQFSQLLECINEFTDLNVIFTKANADVHGRIINQLIDGYVSKNSHRAVAFTSMGQLLYLSTMQYASAVVGNSSSGIIEAPSFRIPTVNIGDRQKGRVRSKSIIDCRPNRAEIIDALRSALSPAFKRALSGLGNPYAKVNTVLNIKRVIKTFDLGNILKKDFYDLRIMKNIDNNP